MLCKSSLAANAAHFCTGSVAAANKLFPIFFPSNPCSLFYLISCLLHFALSVTFFTVIRLHKIFANQDEFITVYVWLCTVQNKVLSFVL